MFKYDKLFSSTAAATPSLAATRRLFYVTCSRAESSLALVAYSEHPDEVASFATREDWFKPDEVVRDLL